MVWDVFDTIPATRHGESDPTPGWMTVTRVSRVSVFFSSGDIWINAFTSSGSTVSSSSRKIACFFFQRKTTHVSKFKFFVCVYVCFDKSRLRNSRDLKERNVVSDNNNTPFSEKCFVIHFIPKSFFWYGVTLSMNPQLPRIYHWSLALTSFFLEIKKWHRKQKNVECV